MVKIERSYPAPESLKDKKSYREKDVIERLLEDFHGKCYICELDKLTDINVEHLRPHKGNTYLDLKFDWDNLFLSCPHCNGIKKKEEYDNMILDCCKVDPEEKINFEFKGTDIRVFSKNFEDKEASKTANLIYEVFNLKNTGIRIYTSDFRFKELQKEMTLLFTLLEKLKNNKDDVLNLKILKEILKRKSRFAAFKRDYVRKNIKNYLELEKFVEL